ncbi:MAG: chorismate-binding protein, partial [Pseudomonas sp.]|nr:chorismate-binding protein [Pseudomonas sp.]
MAFQAGNLATQLLQLNLFLQHGRILLLVDIFQVVLSQRFEIENPPSSFEVYRRLRATNPSPYLYYFKTKDYEIAGAS